MTSVLKKNLDAVKTNHTEIKINEDLVDKYKGNDNIEELISYKGYNICSGVDRNKAIEVWCEQFKDLKHNEVVFSFGTGSLDYYEKLKVLYPDIKVIIYEPAEEIFYNSLACKDYTNFLTKADVCICVGENAYRTFEYSCDSIIGFESINRPFFAQIPNYSKIFEEEYDSYIDMIRRTLKSNIMSRNTAIDFEEDFLDNFLDNLTRISDEATVNELIEQLTDSGINDYPAIILSAGPSLDKNINKIKDIKGRALIIAVDAAVNTAIANNIRPDIIVSDDAHIKVNSSDNSENNLVRREVPLVIRMQGSLSIRDASKGRKFFTSFSYNYIGEVLKEFGKKMPTVYTGGSVANSAFSIAKMLGCKAIILMGQDLGFPGNKQHASDAFENEEDVSEEDERYFYVDSVDGGKVLTSHQMDVYREFFETMIKRDPDYEVIDATEGGALIHGTKLMTIDKAIDKYCPEERLDFEKLINEAPYMVEGEEREKFRSVINKTFEDIDSNIEYLEGAKRDYYKLRDINEKRRYNSKEFKRLVNKVGEHNNYIENNKDFALYKECCNEKHYEFVDALRNVYDDTYEEIKNLVEQSLIMLDEYIKAGKILKEKWYNINR